MLVKKKKEEISPGYAKWTTIRALARMKHFYVLMLIQRGLLHLQEFKFAFLTAAKEQQLPGVV
jgi:hypothetical protein